MDVAASELAVVVVVGEAIALGSVAQP